MMNAFTLPKIPIIQAPMAGGITTPALVSAVAEAGAVGSFGFAYSAADKIASDLAEARARTTGRINANFFVYGDLTAPLESAVIDAIADLDALSLSPEIPYEKPTPPFVPDLEAQLAAMWENAPDYLTFHFGIPPQDVIERAKAAGIMVGINATSIAEAQTIAGSGANFIIAQGYEAGGHRGTFSATADGDERLSTVALTNAISKTVTLPVISAGGIMTASHIIDAQAAGADGVQLGTAFLCADEAGTVASYRDALLSHSHEPTVMTSHFSGRWARAIENEFIIAMNGKRYLPFPFQNILTGQLRKKAIKDNDAQYQSLWAGTGYQSIEGAPAAQIIKRLSEGLYKE